MADNNMTIGQIVDELADKYFASGMDVFTSNVRALLDVAGALTGAYLAVSEVAKSLCIKSEVQHD